MEVVAEIRYYKITHTRIDVEGNLSETHYFETGEPLYPKEGEIYALGPRNGLGSLIIIRKRISFDEFNQGNNGKS